MLELIGPGKDILKRITGAQTLRMAVDKWDLMKLSISVQQRTPQLK